LNTGALTFWLFAEPFAIGELLTEELFTLRAVFFGSATGRGLLKINRFNKSKTIGITMTTITH
jgi:hypothetical protein